MLSFALLASELACQPVDEVLHDSKRTDYRTVKPSEQEGQQSQHTYQKQISGKQCGNELHLGQKREHASAVEVHEHDCQHQHRCKRQNNPDNAENRFSLLCHYACQPRSVTRFLIFVSCAGMSICCGHFETQARQPTHLSARAASSMALYLLRNARRFFA